MGDLVLGGYIRWDFILGDFILGDLVREREAIYIFLFKVKLHKVSKDLVSAETIHNEHLI